MPSRTTNIVLDVFNVLNYLSTVQNGATIGQVQKACSWMSRGQTENALKHLSEMSFAYHEERPHGRTGKRVFFMTENAAIHCASIARTYTERN